MPQIIFYPKIQAILWFIASRFSLAALIVIARLLSTDLNPYQVINLQGFIALAVFCLLTKKQYFAQCAAPKNCLLHITRGALLVFSIATWMSVFDKMHMSQAVTINYSLPLIVTILTLLLLKEKISLSTITTLVIGFVGVLIIIRPEFNEFNKAHILALLATVFWAFAEILNKKLLNKNSSETIVFRTLLSSTIISTPLAIYYWQSVSITQILLIILMAIFSISLYMTTSISYSKYKQINFLQPFDFLRLILTSIAAYIIFGETIDIWSITGFIIILAGNKMLFTLKHREQELVKAKEELEKLYEFEKRDKQRIEELLHEQEHFFEHVLSDLKTPMSCADGALMLVKEGVIDKEEALKMAGSSIDKIRDIANNLIIVAKLERNELTINKNESDIKKIIHENVEKLSYTAANKNIDLSIEEYIQKQEKRIIHLDTNILSRVINNLLSNAIKFTPEGGKITIGYQESETIPHAKTVYIKDNGYGIPEEDIIRIFGNYEEADKGKRQRNTVCLGLHTIRKIVDTHGGIFEIESEIGHGTEIKITLTD